MADRPARRILFLISQKSRSHNSEFAYAADTLARNSGATLLGIRFGVKSTSAGKASSGGHDDSSNTFECTIEGGFPAMVRVVDGFASAASDVRITSAQMTRGQIDPHTGDCKISMHLMGKLDQ